MKRCKISAQLHFLLQIRRKFRLRFIKSRKLTVGPGGLKLELLGNKLNGNNSENGTRHEFENIQMPFFKNK